MKIAILNGSPRNKDGFRVLEHVFSDVLGDRDIELDYINVKDLNIKDCLGCMRCFKESEDVCPLDDDVLDIRDRLTNCDGIVFISPVYAEQITGQMKRAIDRLSFMFHRPELVAKPAISIVTTGGGGMRSTQKYLKLVSSGWGCNLVGQLSIASTMFFKEGEFYNSRYKSNKINEIDRLAKEFYDTIIMNKAPAPSYYDIYMFRGLKSKTYTSKADYDFWESRGWLDSEYYYETKIGPLKKLFGYALHKIIESMISRAKAQS